MEQIGEVQQLWRYPVKSMAGEALTQTALAAEGVLGDRAFALLDVQTGRVVSAKNVRQFPDLLRCRAAFVAPVVPGSDLPPVAIELPEGRSVRSDDPDVDRQLSDALGRKLRLVREAPVDYTVEQHHPDLADGAAAAAGAGKTVATKLGSALFAQLGVPSPVAPGRLVDAFPLSLLSLSTLARMGGLQPASRFELARFRMNVIVEPADAAAVEAAWIGRALSLGPAVRVEVAIPAPRCVVVTRPQAGLAEDLGVLRALMQHNRMPVGPLGPLPCCGLYAVVTTFGALRVGDAVALH
jgi:uncharacterized protein YcbX